MKYEWGFHSSPSTTQARSLSRQHKQQFREGKKGFHLCCTVAADTAGWREKYQSGNTRLWSSGPVVCLQHVLGESPQPSQAMNPATVQTRNTSKDARLKTTNTLVADPQALGHCKQGLLDASGTKELLKDYLRSLLWTKSGWRSGAKDKPKPFFGALSIYSCGAIKSIRWEEEFSCHCLIPEESWVDSIRRRIWVLINAEYKFPLSRPCATLAAYLPPLGCS